MGTEFGDDVTVFKGEIEAGRSLPGTVHEEVDGSGIVEAFDRKQLLARDRQGSATRRDDRHAWAPTKKLRNQGGHRLQDVLAVVDHKHSTAHPEILDEHLAGLADTTSETDRVGDRIEDLDRRSGIREVGERRGIVPGSSDAPDELLGEPGLAATPRSGDGYEAASR